MLQVELRELYSNHPGLTTKYILVSKTNLQLVRYIFQCSPIVKIQWKNFDLSELSASYVAQLPFEFSHSRLLEVPSIGQLLNFLIENVPLIIFTNEISYSNSQLLRFLNNSYSYGCISIKYQF